MTTLEAVQQRAESDAKTHGYYLNPDPSFLQDLLEGLKRNEERYGYPSCPCRLASGKFELDRDIICPCDYRDPDVQEFGSCYCALYVKQGVFERKSPLVLVPERRLLEKQIITKKDTSEIPYTDVKVKKDPKIRMKLWFCKQCGYVCFRDEPPYICPICKAKRELFGEIPTDM